MLNSFLATYKTKKSLFSRAKGREKRDRKVPRKCGFEGMASFALVVGSEDPSCTLFSHYRKSALYRRFFG